MDKKAVLNIPIEYIILAIVFLLLGLGVYILVRKLTT
jgi:hypothetical protein